MSNEPVTRADLEAPGSRLDRRLDVMEQRIVSGVAVLIRDSETRLLQAFYGFAEATNKRFNQIDWNMGIFLSRLGTVENRLLEVEKRLNIPPTL